MIEPENKDRVPDEVPQGKNRTLFLMVFVPVALSLALVAAAAISGQNDAAAYLLADTHGMYAAYTVWDELEPERGQVADPCVAASPGLSPAGTTDTGPVDFAIVYDQDLGCAPEADPAG